MEGCIMRSEQDTTIHPGTRDVFRQWLNSKSLSITKYNKLPHDVKMKIQNEYKGR